MNVEYYNEIIKSFFKLSGNAVFEISEDYEFMTVFTEDPSYLFLPEEEFIGKKVSEVLPAPFWNNLLAVFEAAKAYGQKQVVEYPAPVPGDNRWFRGSVVFAKPGQNPPFFLLSVTDITAQRQTEQSLQFHARFEDLLVHATSVLIQSKEDNFDVSLQKVLAKIGSFADVDRAYLFMFSADGILMNNTHEWCSEGVSSEKDNLQDVPCAIVPEWMKKLHKNEEVYIPDVSALPDSWKGVRELLEPQGVQSLLVLPVKAEGKLYGFIGFDAVKKRVIWDLSKRHLLQILADNLGSVIMRNEQNLNLLKATEQAHLLAQEATLANRYKSDFLANMSHEIRTPLNGVMGFTELLMETRLTETQRQYITNVHNSASSLLQLINQILDFSKIESGKMELDVDRSDLFQIVEKTCVLARHAARNKQVEFLLNLPPGIPRYYMVDAVKLQQVLANLLSNAIKFTQQGTVELKVTFSREEEGIAKLSFTVTDTGIGIAEEHQKRVFQAFAQADISTTRKYGGTGLGLAISNSLLSMMGSELYLESKFGEGSNFSFEMVLPYVEEPAFNKDNNTGLKKVLVVDDHASSRDILTQWLHHKDIQVVEAKSATQALGLMSSDTFDLLIIDQEMPSLKGIQLLNMIREDMDLLPEKLPAIMLYSKDDPEFHNDCKQAGVKHQLAKPITPTEFFGAMESLKERSGLQFDLTTSGANEHAATARKGGKKRILIAEDNSTNLLFTRIMVESLFMDCEILEARNGIEAIQVYTKQQPDLVLMDIQMPEMDGDAATVEIRKLESEQNTPHTPIIALTANAIKGVREKCLADGFDDYITKPTNKTDLTRLLEKYV